MRGWLNTHFSESKWKWLNWTVPEDRNHANAWAGFSFQMKTGSYTCVPHFDICWYAGKAELSLKAKAHTKLRVRFQVFLSFIVNTCPSYSSFCKSRPLKTTELEQSKIGKLTNRNSISQNKLIFNASRTQKRSYLHQEYHQAHTN